VERAALLAAAAIWYVSEYSFTSVSIAASETSLITLTMSRPIGIYREPEFDLRLYLIASVTATRACYPQTCDFSALEIRPCGGRAGPYADAFLTRFLPVATTTLRSMRMRAMIKPCSRRHGRTD